MTGLFDYPKSAAFGRVLPKTKIYEHAGANTVLKDLFVRQVDQIIWRYKLAPETINLSATKSVSEIQILEISLKTGKLDESVQRAIDKAIPFPLIFELTHGGKRKAMAAYKRPNEADSAKWVISEYFATGWVANAAVRMPLPLALNLGALYDAILSAILGDQNSARSSNGNLGEAPQTTFDHGQSVTREPMAVRIERMEAIRAKTREIDRIKARLAREKQFNKRVAINAELRVAKQGLDQFMGICSNLQRKSQ